MITTLHYDIYDNCIGEHICRRSLLRLWRNMEDLELARLNLERRLKKLYNKDDIRVTFFRADGDIRQQAWFRRMVRDLEAAR